MYCSFNLNCDLKNSNKYIILTFKSSGDFAIKSKIFNSIAKKHIYDMGQLSDDNMLVKLNELSVNAKNELNAATRENNCIYYSVLNTEMNVYHYRHMSNYGGMYNRICMVLAKDELPQEIMMDIWSEIMCINGVMYDGLKLDDNDELDFNYDKMLIEGHDLLSDDDVKFDNIEDMSLSLSNIQNINKSIFGFISLTSTNK